MAASSVEQLMERAGAGLAEAAYRFAGPLSGLILCGPGNNGGDGYVARAASCRARASRSGSRRLPSRRATQRNGRERNGPASRALSPDTRGAPLLIDALFGTGLTRGLDDAVSLMLSGLVHEAVVAVACDVPSGVEFGHRSACSPRSTTFDLTVTFGALKPAHLLRPAMHKCGRVVLADIGIEADGEWHEIGAAAASAARSGSKQI